MQCSRCIVFKILLLCLDLCLTIISLASPIYPHCLPTETLCTELFVADRQLSLSEGVYPNKRRGLNIKYKCQTPIIQNQNKIVTHESPPLSVCFASDPKGIRWDNIVIGRGFMFWNQNWADRVKFSFGDIWIESIDPIWVSQGSKKITQLDVGSW